MVNVREFFRWPLFLLKVFGMNQDQNSSWFYRVYGFVIHVAFIDLFTLFHVFYFFNFEGFQELSDCIGTFLTNFGQFIKTLNFMIKLKTITKLIDNLEFLVKLSTYAENKDRIQLKKHMKKVLLVYKFMVVSAVATCLLAGLVPLFNKQDHKLAYRMYFPGINYTNNDTIFILLALYQMSPVFICIITITLDCMPIFFLSLVTGVIEELSDRMEDIGRKLSIKEIFKNPQRIVVNQSDDEIMKELLKCVKIHLKIKKFIEEIQGSFSLVIAVQGILSSIIFCSTAFMLSLVSFGNKLLKFKSVYNKKLWKVLLKDS